MEKHLEFPKLRWPIDLKLHEIENNKPVLVITCPLGLTLEPLCLIPEVSAVIQLFDGSNSVNQIADRLSGNGATPEIVAQIADLLDSNLFLDGPHFKAAEAKIKEQFRQVDIRPAVRAGYVYPADAAALGREIDGYLVNGSTDTGRLCPDSMMGLMAPHIDYRRGGNSYGKTYAALRGGDHELYVLMGTSHQYSELLFHLTRKSFACPLGDAPCQHSFVEQLAQRYGYERSFQDEFLHKEEHSIELQIPFLQRVQSGAKIVPILIGSFHEMIVSDRLPESLPAYDEFVGALAELIAGELRAGTRVCFIAGVDMAHVGRAFGDPGELTPGFMEEIGQRDQLYLDSIIRQDNEALFAHIAEDRDARRICGFPTMYTLIDLFGRLDIAYQCNVFDYSQTVDYKTDCAVTFAGLGMYTV